MAALHQPLVSGLWSLFLMLSAHWLLVAGDWDLSSLESDYGFGLLIMFGFSLTTLRASPVNSQLQCQKVLQRPFYRP
jgi:hypothetical protein